MGWLLLALGRHGIILCRGAVRRDGFVGWIISLLRAGFLVSLFTFGTIPVGNYFEVRK